MKKLIEMRDELERSGNAVFEDLKKTGDPEPLNALQKSCLEYMMAVAAYHESSETVDASEFYAEAEEMLRGIMFCRAAISAGTFEVMAKKVAKDESETRNVVSLAERRKA